VLDSLRGHEPDVVVLTEFRNNDTGLRIRQGLESLGLRHQSGSYAAASVNAVLVAARQRFAEQTFDALRSDAHRCVLAQLAELSVFGLYFPNREAKAPLFKFLVGLAPPYIGGLSLLLGDFNTGRHYIDEAGATFVCSEHFERLVEQGWVDAWRHRHPEAREYTWYSPRGNGFRSDHPFVSPPMLPRIRRVAYSHREREARVSDHSVLVVDLE
jgi:exonuclease III